MIKRLILILILLISIAYGQSYLPMGNALERKIVGQDTSFRFKLGSPGIWNITDYYTARLALKVGITGNESIAGIKTFTSSPVVPTATNNNQAVNLGQVGGIAPELPNGVVTQGVISINDITYLVTVSSPFEVRFDNVVITTDIAPDNTLQLLAYDGTYNRIDAIYSNSDGSYGFVTGAATATPTPPNVPSNTIQLALIYRFTDGSNAIVYSTEAGYYRTTGGDINGQVYLKNENNLNLDSRIGGTDTGDLLGRVWDGTTGVEKWRIWNRDSDTEGDLYIRYGASENGGLGYKIARKLSLSFNQSNLVVDGDLIYLEVTGLGSNWPYAIKVTQGSTTITNLVLENNSGWSNPRYYGFANTNTQTITILIL